MIERFNYSGPSNLPVLFQNELVFQYIGCFFRVIELSIRITVILQKEEAMLFRRFCSVSIESHGKTHAITIFMNF